MEEISRTQLRRKLRYQAKIKNQGQESQKKTSKKRRLKQKQRTDREITLQSHDPLLHPRQVKF